MAVILFGSLVSPSTAQPGMYVRAGNTIFPPMRPRGSAMAKQTRLIPAPVNKHCAFKDVRYLWSDGSYTYGKAFPGWGWVGSGGDTYIIRGSIGTGVTWRVGWNSPSTYCDPTGCWGITGDAPASGAPPPPSRHGIAGHTRILEAENYAACRKASAKTQFHGGWGVGTVLNLSGVSYVDVACLDVTDSRLAVERRRRWGAIRSRTSRKTGFRFRIPRPTTPLRTCIFTALLPMVSSAQPEMAW